MTMRAAFIQPDENTPAPEIRTPGHFLLMGVVAQAQADLARLEKYITFGLSRDSERLLRWLFFEDDPQQPMSFTWICQQLHVSPRGYLDRLLGEHRWVIKHLKKLQRTLNRPVKIRKRAGNSLVAA